MPLIRYETSKQLDYETPQLKVIVTKRAVYACPRKHDEAKLVTAPKPPQVIDKGLAAPGLLAAMVIARLPAGRDAIGDLWARVVSSMERKAFSCWWNPCRRNQDSMRACMKPKTGSMT